jgi:hypothetical protein
MEKAATDEDGDMVAGLIVDDGDGHYFAIAWDELPRFRVPESHLTVVEALVHGAEAIAADLDVRGYADGEPMRGANALLEEAMTGPARGRGRLAARRLRAWALLR